MGIYFTPTAGLLKNPRLYSTVRVSLIDAETNEVIEALYDEAAQYEKSIAREMASFQTDLHPTNNLMAYFEIPDNPDAESRIKEKVLSACPTVCAVGKELYAALDLELKDDLTDTELYIFAEQIQSQYADGWGAEFEERNILTSTGETVSLRLFHSDIDFSTASKFNELVTESAKEDGFIYDDQNLTAAQEEGIGPTMN